MKKFSFFSISAVLVIAFGCAKVEVELVPVDNDAINTEVSIPFELFANHPATKTVNDGLDTKWSDGDAINVFHAVKNTTTYVNDGEFTLTDAASGKFEGTLASALNPAEDYDWYIIYPYNPALTTPAPATTKGQSWYYNIGGVHQTQAGNDDKGHLAGVNMPFAGKVTAVEANETPSLTLDPLTSILAIKVTNNSGSSLTVTDLAFTAPSGTDITGKFYVDFSGASVTYTAQNTGQTFQTVPLYVSGATALGSGESAKYYVAIKPFVASAGSSISVTVNGYTKNIASLSENVTFAAGNIKTLNFNYNQPVPDAISTSSDVQVTFESGQGFTSASQYNGQYYIYKGTNPWGILSGNTTNTSSLRITGTQTLHMRWYATEPETIPVAFTRFRLSSVGHVTFKAKNSSGASGLKLKLYYSEDNRATWTLGDTFDITESAAEYTLGFASAKSNVAFKFETVVPSPAPGSGNLQMTIDDVTFSKDIINPRVTVAANAATSVTDDGATLNGTITLIDGASLSRVTSAGFYYKKTSDPGSFNKVYATIPLATVNFSKAVDGLDEDNEYTFKAFAVYNSGEEVESTTLTFKPSSTPSEKYSVIKNVSGLSATSYFMGSNNKSTFAGSTTIQLWTGAVSLNKLSKISATWDSSTGDFDSITGAATVSLEAGTGTNVWRIKVGSKYLAASGTTFSLSDDSFDWTFENRGSNEGIDFYNTTSGTYVSCNSTGDVARAYDASTKKYQGIYFFQEN